MNDDMYPRSNHFLDVVGRASAHVAAAVLADMVAAVFIGGLIGVVVGVVGSLYYSGGPHFLGYVFSAMCPMLGAVAGYAHTARYWKKVLNRPEATIVR